VSTDTPGFSLAVTRSRRRGTLFGRGGSGGDGQSDVVIIEGTSGDDVIRLSMQNGALVIDGLASRIVIENFDPTDQIRLMGLGGNDVIDASMMPANGPP